MRITAAAVFALLLAGCAGAATRPRSGRWVQRSHASDAAPTSQTGTATWYSDSLAGRHTASGVPYDPTELTAAHRTLPFGTRVRVTRLDNNRSVEVVVNDRGPFGSRTRIIDLSRRAAEELEMLRAGVARVRVDVLELGDGRRHGH